MNSIQELHTLLNSKRKLILVQTYEESRFIQEFLPFIQSKNYDAVSWSITSGTYDLIQHTELDPKLIDPVMALHSIMQEKKPTAFFLKDFHDIWEAHKGAKRKLRDYLESAQSVYKPIIIISPVFTIPAELEKSVTVVNYEVPNRQQVIKELEGMEQFLTERTLPVPEGRDREAIINALLGMTALEIENVLKKSVSKHRRIELSEIVAEKEQVIKKTGLLQYITKLGDIENVGGMDLFKQWIDDAKYAFDHEAKELKIDPTRGCILSGFPGTGKSLTAKSIAHFWNLPLLKMSMSDIMDSRVGQSEKNIARALRLAETVSPCVLWIDELEKALSGMGSSDKSDSGTLSRVVQEILTWLSDKTAPVFVVATANDISGLKPELTRAGRFDEIFYVSLPHLSEREDIFRIHLLKRGYEQQGISEGFDENRFSQNTLNSLAKQTDQFSGAEIEQVVAESTRRAYASFKKGNRPTHYITYDDLVSQIKAFIPLSRRNPDLLIQYKEFAKTSAKCASSLEFQQIHQDDSISNRNKTKIYLVDNLQ